MERLQGEGVRGADLVFACIGPALEIFSRYAKVETADGREVALAEYLEKVWEVVGRSALAQVLGTAEAKARNGAAGAVEEDARLTALFLWTLQSTNGEAADDASDEGEDEEPSDEDDDEEGSSRGKAKGFTLVFDVVRRFAQPLGIELPKWEGRVIETKKGVVRLLPIAERAKQLFGEDGAQAVAARLEQEAALGTNPLQGMLFPEIGRRAPKVRGRGPGPRQARGRRGLGREPRRRPRGHDPRPRPRGDAPPGRRPHQRAARAAQGRAGARPRLPAPRQRPLGALPEGQRGEAPARRDAAGGAEVTAMGTSDSSRAVWQISGGPASRAYADVFLKHGVALIGPGDAGPWTPERDDDEFEGGFVRRFASEVAAGDVFLLRTGIATIAAVGLVAGDYLYVNAFDDVNGWDLQHARRVRWCRLPAEHAFAERGLRRQPAALLAGVERGGRGLRGALPQLAADALADGAAARSCPPRSRRSTRCPAPCRASSPRPPISCRCFRTGRPSASTRARTS